MNDDTGILTSDTARRMLGYISPVYGSAHRFLKIFDAIGGQMQQLNDWSGQLAQQAMPQTVTWALPLWEREYALAGDSRSDDIRRATLLSKVRSLGAANPWAIMRNVTAITGYESKVEENSGRNKFTIWLNHYIADAGQIGRAVDPIKPAHLIYDIKCWEDVYVPAVSVCGAQYGRHCVIRQAE